MVSGSATQSRLRRVGIARVVRETADAVSLVLDVAADDAAAFAYRAGQFVTLRVLIDGVAHLRSYSMSTAPGVDPDLRVTVKRVPGGLVSNWVHDVLRAGDRIDVLPPAGAFVVEVEDGDGDGDGDGHIHAFAAGSGITPVFSIVKDVLARSDRPVRLLYANRDRASAIFAAELDALAARHPGRCEVVHHADMERGLLRPDDVAAFAGGGRRDGDHYVCGPDGFMAVVEAGLRARGVDERRIHVERFTPAEPPAPTSGTAIAARVTVRLGGRSATVDHRPGTTVLQTARSAGLRAPSSCETGTCATCMARVVEGRAVMRNNEALTDEEVAEGWVLTCQAEPTTPTLSVVYE